MMEGWILLCTKFGEHIITSPLFLKGTDAIKQNFLESTGAANKATPVKDWRLDDGSFVQNKINRDTKALCFLLAGMGEHDIREHIPAHLNECIRALPAHMRKIKDSDFPNLRPGRDHHVVETWDQIAGDEDIIFLLKKQTDNVGAFLEEKKQNTHGLWRPGKLPVWAMKRCDLEEEHLEPLDWENLKQHDKNEKEACNRAMAQNNARHGQGGAFAEGFNHTSNDDTVSVPESIHLTI